MKGASSVEDREGTVRQGAARRKVVIANKGSVVCVEFLPIVPSKTPTKKKASIRTEIEAHRKQSGC